MKSTGLIWTAVTILLCCVHVTGCKKQKPIAAIPPPPVVKTVPPVQHVEKLPEPPAPQTSPPEQVAPSTITSQPPADIPPPPETPKKVKRRVLRKPAPVQTAPAVAPLQTAKADPAPAAMPPASEAEPAHRLGQLLSPAEEQDYNQSIDQELQRAKNNLTLALAKTLSDPQKAVTIQVQSFIRQAEDLRKTDLVEAKGLSHKADILASDLARSLQ